MSQSKAAKFDPQWAKAKSVCRLNMEEIRMAKVLGLSPKSLMKNVPSPNERWKLPVKQWIRELHEKRFGRKKAEAQVPAGSRAAPENDHSNDDAADEPF